MGPAENAILLTAIIDGLSSESRYAEVMRHMNVSCAILAKSEFLKHC